MTPGSLPAIPNGSSEPASIQNPLSRGELTEPLSASGWLTFLVAGVVAGLLSCLAVHFSYDSFRLPHDVLVKFDQSSIPEGDQRIIAEAQGKLLYQRTTILLAAVGAIVGSLLSLATALTFATARRPLSAILMGSLLGAIFGALAGRVGLEVGDYLRSNTEDELLRISGMHAIFWMVIGVGVGLAVGVVRRRRGALPRSLVVVLAAGALAAAVYSPLAGTLFPVEEADTAIPIGFGSRLLWTMLAAGCMAVLLARTFSHSGHLRARERATAEARSP